MGSQGPASGSGSGSSGDNFCLRWNDFTDNLSHAFKEIRQNQDLFDVTLVVDEPPGDDADNANAASASSASTSWLKAHKLILSACSPFFRDLLRMDVLGTHPNPVLFLRGVSRRDLRHVLDFMYHGEVNVPQEGLEPFLAVAETLKVKGLTQNEDAANTGDSSSSEQHSTPRRAGGAAPKRPASSASSSSHTAVKRRPGRPPGSKSAQNSSAQAAVVKSEAGNDINHDDDDDDILEVVPVKHEQPSLDSSTSAGGGAGGVASSSSESAGMTPHLLEGGGQPADDSHHSNQEGGGYDELEEEDYYGDFVTADLAEGGGEGVVATGQGTSQDFALALAPPSPSALKEARTLTLEISRFLRLLSERHASTGKHQCLSCGKMCRDLYDIRVHLLHHHLADEQPRLMTRMDGFIRQNTFASGSSSAQQQFTCMLCRTVLKTAWVRVRGHFVAKHFVTAKPKQQKN